MAGLTTPDGLEAVRGAWADAAATFGEELGWLDRHVLAAFSNRVKGWIRSLGGSQAPAGAATETPRVAGTTDPAPPAEQWRNVIGKMRTCGVSVDGLGGIEVLMRRWGPEERAALVAELVPISELAEAWLAALGGD
jgi:hypothetical protein